MAMLRPKGKAKKIAQNVMKGKGVSIANAKPSGKNISKQLPFLQH